MTQACPRFEQCREAFFERRSSHKERIGACAGTTTGIATEEIGFYHDLSGWQPALDELVSGESGERDVKIDHLFPSLFLAMHFQHQSHGRRSHPRVAITCVSHAPQKPMLHALLARLPVAKEIRGGAKQAIVVERLDNRNSFFLAHRIN